MKWYSTRMDGHGALMTGSQFRRRAKKNKTRRDKKTDFDATGDRGRTKDESESDLQTAIQLIFKSTRGLIGHWNLEKKKAEGGRSRLCLAFL